MMKRWIITAESGSDIGKEEAKKLGIEIIPMHVTMGGKTYDDGTFSSEEICKYYNETRQVPKTSGCSPFDFELFFDRIHLENPEAHILHLAYSAATTVSYNSARLQSAEKDYITVVDTKHVSAGQRVVVLQVLNLIKRQPNISTEDLTLQIDKISRKTKMCFMPSNLEYLCAGGRCSNMAYLGGTLLNLHPCIEIIDGKLIATKKYRGNLLKVIPKLIREYTKANELDKTQLWLISSPGLNSEIKLIAEKASQAYGFNNVSWVSTGNVITTHGGPGAFGIVGLKCVDVI